MGLDLNEESMEGNDFSDQPKSIMKLPQAHEYVQLVSNFVVEHHLKFLVVDVTVMQSFMDKSNKMSISNINKHHQKTTNYYFRSV